MKIKLPKLAFFRSKSEIFHPQNHLIVTPQGRITKLPRPNKKIIVALTLILLTVSGFFVYQKISKQPVYSKAAIENTNASFKVNESARFTLKLNEGILATDKDQLTKNISAKIALPSGNIADNIQVSVDPKNADSVEIRADQTSNTFLPGKYSLKLALSKNGQTREITQDFTWGVLALNFNKSIYKPNDQAFIQYGTVDDLGHTICDADLTLEISTPNGNKTTLSSDKNTIKRSGDCGLDNITDKPDYSSLWTIPQEVGTYNLTLTAKTRNGTRTIKDYFEVRESTPFVIDRSGPTRIYPLSQYKVELKITANQNYSGTITETVPKDFIITKSQGKFTETIDGQDKKLSWQANLQANQTITLSYIFDAPDISPEFYLLGPLTVGNFGEIRQWQIASDAVAVTGTVYYGDISATNGVLRAKTFTASSTFGTEFNGAASGTSFIVHTVAKTAPTREEQMIGNLKVDGSLYIETCTTGCDLNGDYTARWSNAGTTATQDCDNAPTASTCERAFDIAYEAISGRAMVVYGDSVADKFYYALWDGSAWSPDTSPDTPSATNEVDFNTGGTGGTPEWIRVISMGDDLDDTRNNRMMVLISDTNAALFACYWDGSSFTCGSALESALELCTVAQCFDGAWSTNNLFVLAYGDTSASDVKTQSYTVGSGWGGESAAFTVGGATQWFHAHGDPTSTRIILSESDSANEAEYAIWRTDDSTNGWTECSATDCPDTSTEVVSGRMATAQFQRQQSGGSNAALYTYLNAGTTNDSTFFAYTANTTWGTATTTIITTTDDAAAINNIMDPNSNGALTFVVDIDCDLWAKYWTGSSYGGTTTSIELSSSYYGGNTCANANPGADGSAGMPFTAAFDWYSPWQRNWRFYTDISANEPSTGAAAENVTPTVNPEDFIRLRLQFYERGATAQTDARKKLEYTSGCTPNTDPLACTWADVGDTGETSAVWRYATSGETCTNCTDNTAVVTNRLTGSTQVGTHVADKDLAAGTAMDHSASTILENDYAIKAEAVAQGTVYYFRANDLDQLTPVYTYNPSGVTDCLSAACTYPSVTIPITVSGNVYTAGTTSAPALCDHTTPTNNVAIRSNGTTTLTSCNTSTGAFTASVPMPAVAGDGIIVWIDGNATDGATAIRYDGTGNSTGHIVYTNTATVTSDDATATTNTVMDFYDSGGDVDIPYTVTTSNLTVASGIELLVFTGKSYTPGGTVATTGAADFHVDDSSTATLGNATNAMSRDILVDAGATLNINADTTIAGGDITTTSTGAVAATGGTVTMDGSGNIGGGSGAITIYNLVVSNTFTTTITSSTTISNNLTVTGSLASSGSVTTTVNGAISGTGTISYTGTSTFKQRVAVNQNFGATTGAVGWTFNNLIFSNSNGTSRTITTQTGGTGTMTVSGVLTLGEGGDTATTVLDAGNRTWTLSGTTGAPIAVNASSTLTGNSSTFSLTGNNTGGNTSILTLTFFNLTLNASEIFDASGTITVDGDLTVTAGTFALGTNNITVGSTTAGSGDVSISGSITQSASGTFSAKTAAAATPTFGGAGTISLYNLSFIPGAAGAAYTLGSGVSQTISVANRLTIGDGANSVSVNANTNDPTVDVNENFVIAASGTYDQSSATTMTVAKSFTITGTYNGNTTGNITLDGSSATDDSTVTCTGSIGGTITFSKTGDGDISIGSGCTVVAPAGGISMTGNIVNDGTITNGGTTFNLDNVTGGQGNLTNNGTGVITYAGTAMTIEGSVTQSGTFVLTGITLTLDGTASTDDSTVTCGTLGGTLAFNKTGGATVTIATSCVVSVATISMTGNYVNNGTTNISGATFNLDSTSGSGGSLTNGASSTMTYSGTAITLEKDYTLTAGGTFNLSGKTMTFDGADTTDDSILTCATTLAGTFDIAKTIQGADFTLSASCIITMVSNVTTYGSITVNGTMTGTTIHTRGSVTKASGGTLTVSNTTLIFEDGGVATNSTLDCSSGTITGSVEVNMTNASSTFAITSSCTITANFTRTDGPFSNPGSAYTLTVQGDFSMSTTDAFGGANLTLTMGGSASTQTITQNAGTMSGVFSVNKSSGTAKLLTALTTGTTCNVTSGIFWLNGQNLTCITTFTVTTTLQLNGNETISPTPTLSSGSYAIFVGDGDTATDSFNLPNYSWRNLTINSTDGLSDTIVQQVNTTVAENFCIQAGTYNVNSLTLDITGTVCNNGGLMTNAGDFNYPSNTIKLTDNVYAEKADFAQGDTIYMTVTDVSVNLSGASAETLTVTVTTTAGDSETRTLTETGNSTTIFRGSVTSSWGTFSISNNNIEMVQSDVLTMTYVDASQAGDTGSDTATTTADPPPSGGGGSGKLTSTNFQMDGAFGSFGENKSSTNYKLSDTGGLLAAGPGSSTNYKLGSGFPNWIVTSNRLELTISATTIPFGTLTPGTPATGNHDLTVISDAPSGYQVTAQETTRLANLNYAGVYIPDTIGDSSTITHTVTGAWTSNSIYGFGYTLANVVGTDAAFTSGSGYRNFADASAPENPVAVMTKGSATSSSQVTVTYKVNVDAAQQPGSYETKVTYIISGTY